MAYEADISIISSYKGSLQTVTQEFIQVSERLRFEINLFQNKVMRTSTRKHILGQLRVNEFILNGTRKFKYFGSIITVQNDSQKDINAKVLAGDRS